MRASGAECAGRLVRCEAAAAAIEFAIVVPLLLMLVFGIIEFCLVSYERSVLDGALTFAARQGATGEPDVSDKGLVGGRRWNSARALLLAQSGGLFDPYKIQLSATSYPDFRSLGQKGKGVSGSLGGPGDVVAYTVSYPYPVLPFMQAIFGSGGRIVATSLVRNEVFAAAEPSGTTDPQSSATASQASPAPSVPQVAAPSAAGAAALHMRACTPAC